MKIFIGLIISLGLLFASVDINNASKGELLTLNGVGAKKADAIIVYRKGHCFKTLKSLTNVKGIGDKFLEKNKKNLTIGKCKK